MPARKPDTWRHRITGMCLSPGCQERASRAFKRRWCDDHGQVLARVRESMRGKESTRTLSLSKPVDAPPAQPRVTMNPRADGLCAYECERRARRGRSACAPCSAARERVPGCAHADCERAALGVGGFCRYHDRALRTVTDHQNTGQRGFGEAATVPPRRILILVADPPTDRDGLHFRAGPSR